MTCLPSVRSTHDQRSFRRDRDHIEDGIRCRNDMDIKRQLLGLRASHADRRDVDQHLRALFAELGLPRDNPANGPVPGPRFVTRHDQAVSVTAIAQGAGHCLGHAAAATQGERGVLGYLVGFQQLGNGDVVGVEGLEMAARC